MTRARAGVEGPSYFCAYRQVGTEQDKRVHVSPHTRAHVLRASPRARHVFPSKGTRSVPFADRSARPKLGAHRLPPTAAVRSVIEQAGAVVHTNSVTFEFCVYHMIASSLRVSHFGGDDDSELRMFFTIFLKIQLT